MDARIGLRATSTLRNIERLQRLVIDVSDSAGSNEQVRRSVVGDGDSAAAGVALLSGLVFSGVDRASLTNFAHVSI